jgi:hypothetical protein
MTEKQAQRTIIALLLTSLVACSGGDRTEEVSADEAKLTLTHPDGDDMPVESMTVEEDGSGGASRADDATGSQSEIGTATQAVRRARCCECTSDAAGQCTAWYCYPCED